MKNLVHAGIAGLSLVFTGSVLAEGKPGHAEFGSVDQNRDGRVSRVEAQAYTELTSQFATLDADRDSYLSQTEFGKWKPVPAPVAPVPPESSKPPMGNDPAVQRPAPQSTDESSQAAGEAR